MTRRLLLSGLLVLIVCGAAGPAHAAFDPGAQIVSVDNAIGEQGDGAATDAVITPDGRYVVFQTRATNFFGDNDPDPPGDLRQGGIFRYDRQTGALALVADGNLVTDDADTTLIRQGAVAPSVSADGRYVAFYSAQQLVPQDTDDFTDVYVRDMNVALTHDRRASGAYAIVSARDGTDTPASWGTPVFNAPGRQPGATVWADAAITADGSRVVFNTESPSDLPAEAGATTPGGQVFIRDLRAKTTTLMTKAMADGSPAGGAVSPGPAVISADGTTVAWVGSNAPAQTVFVPGEQVDTVHHFYLWRRIAGTVTRRITGIGDPDDPGCTAATPMTTNPTSNGPCYGPLTDSDENGGNITRAAPALSPDGFRVAFLATGGLRPALTWGAGLDAFLTDMHPGLSRKASTIELTRDGVTPDARTAPPIQGIAMSADGQHLVLATNRVSFILPEPALTDVARATPDSTELYEIDLGTNTIQRVVHSLTGGDAAGDADARPTVTADGSQVAFTSAADNLFFGDANGVADAFVATRTVARSVAGPPPGANLKRAGFSIATPTAVKLRMTAKSAKDGSAKLTVTTPGSGTLGVVITARLAVSSSRAAKTKPKTRTVTLITRAPKAVKKGATAFTLRLTGANAKLLRKATIRATARATYQPGAGLALHRSVTVVFKKPVATKKKSPTKKHKVKRA